MTPNIMKSFTDTSKFSNMDLPQNGKSDSTDSMDGDHSAKTMESGSNAATNAMDQTDGLHEGTNQGVCVSSVPGYH